MAKQVDAWEAAGDKSIHYSREDAISRELEMLVNPGAVKGMSIRQAMRWIVMNFSEVKKVVEQ